MNRMDRKPRPQKILYLALCWSELAFGNFSLCVNFVCTCKGLNIQNKTTFFGFEFRGFFNFQIDERCDSGMQIFTCGES